jgi:hypothetical protein
MEFLDIDRNTLRIPIIVCMAREKKNEKSLQQSGCWDEKCGKLLRKPTLK